MFKFLSVLFFSIVSLLHSVHANEVKFLSVDFPPYTYQTPTGGAGAIYDVVYEISKRLGAPAKIEFVPWARARFEAENNSNVALIPLARTKEREEKYSWVVHVLDDPYVLVTLKNSKVNISNLAEAKKLKVGFLASSVAEPLLKEMGFTNAEVATTDIQNVKKLKLGRIDAWVSPFSCRGKYFKEGGLGVNDVRVGLELTILHEYLGASKDLNPKIIKKWQQTFSEMKKDGTYKAIMKKYELNPLP